MKKPGVLSHAAFDENLQQRILALFWFNALIIASNGMADYSTLHRR